MDRTEDLLRSVDEIAAGESLGEVLQRIVEAARHLAPSRYAALGVLADDGTLQHFVHTGMTEEEAAATGDCPTGKGILGLLTREGRTLRLDDVATHPAAVGFPAGHPAMRSFIGTPIVVGGKVFGNLYLGEKVGGEAFSEDDQQLIVGLAAAAGVAIRHAEVLSESLQRERELLARDDVTTALLGGASPREVLQVAVERARQLTGSETALMLVARGNVVVVEAAAGSSHDLDDLVGRRIAADPATLLRLQGELIDTGPHELIDPLLRRLGSGHVHAGAAMFAGERHGVVLLARTHEAPAFGEGDGTVLRALADLAAVVLRHERAHEELRRLAILDDRGRIARDLHDTVVQRLFALGLEVQALASDQGLAPDIASDLHDVADRLDDVIEDIRTAVFMLRRDEDDTGSLRERLGVILAEARRALGFEPVLSIAGPVETVCGPELTTEILATAREMLANVARHAEARHAWVRLEASSGEVELTVRDDGRGFDPSETSLSGLGNLSQRARQLGGKLEIASDEGGTALAWRAPTL